MSDSDSELNGVTNAMEASDLAGEFKLRALNNNKLFYFSKSIIQKNNSVLRAALGGAQS